MKKSILSFIAKYYDRALIFVIILLAAFLRLYKIADYMTFLGDEGRDALIVYGILHGDLTLLGPTASVGGFFLGPIYYYFMAPFLWLSNYNPAGPAVMVALFGIATVFLVYKVGKEFFGTYAAFIASALYAISPLVVGYSRSSWNPNPMPFFSLFTFYVLYKGIQTNKTHFFLIAGFLLGIAIQLHYLAVFLIAIVTVYIALARFFRVKVFSTTSKKNVLFSLLAKDYLFLGVGFVIGWSPFLAFEIRHGFPNLYSITNFIFSSGDTGGNNKFFTIISDVFFRLFGRLITKYPPPEQVSVIDSLTTIDIFITSFKIPVFYLYYFTQFLALGSVVVLLTKLKKSFEKKDSNFYKYFLIIIWLFLGIVLFGFYKKAIYDYYLGFMFPLPFLLLGSFLSEFSTHLYSVFLFLSRFFSKHVAQIIKEKKKFITTSGFIVGSIIFVALFVLNISGIPFRYPANRQFEQVQKISRFIFDKTQGKPYNFALITGGNSDHGYRYFFKQWGQDPVVIQNSEIDPKRTSVTDQLFVVCELVPCAPIGHSLWEIAGFGQADVDGVWDVSVVKVYKLKHYTGN